MRRMALFILILLMVPALSFGGNNLLNNSLVHEIGKIKPRAFKVDIGLRIIGAKSCECVKVESIGAMYFNDIKALVDIGKAKNMGVTLTATFFDLMKGRQVKITKHVVLQRSDYVDIAYGHFLMKTQPGLTIEVKPDLPFIDSNQANNKITIHRCQTCWIPE